MRKDVKKKVLYCLRNYPETRNCDIELTAKLWEHFYPRSVVIGGKSGKKFVAISDLNFLPREDNLKRYRAYIQNTDGLYPPTSWEVARRRDWERDQWHKAMAFGTE